MVFQFQVDDDTQRLFEIAVHFLQEYFAYSEEQAVDMINHYYLSWINTHDDDYYHQILSFQIAVRVHYFIGLNGNSDDSVEWRSAEKLNAQSPEAAEYFRQHYFQK